MGGVSGNRVAFLAASRMPSVMCGHAGDVPVHGLPTCHAGTRAIYTAPDTHTQTDTQTHTDTDTLARGLSPTAAIHVCVERMACTSHLHHARPTAASPSTVHGFCPHAVVELHRLVSNQHTAQIDIRLLHNRHDRPRRVNNLNCDHGRALLHWGGWLRGRSNSSSSCTLLSCVHGQHWPGRVCRPWPCEA